MSVSTEIILMSFWTNHGWTDFALSRFLKKDEIEIRINREKQQVYPAYQSVDTCAAEFEADTPYLYSTYKGEDESVITDRKKIMILGGGPNRIGQGIEFDYCCVHAAMALSEVGYETIMVNSNPETVSTDFDVSDKLYFEPLTTEHVLNIARREKPEGVIVQFGGQTPLKIAKSLEENGLKILGTSTDSIDMAEDRERCEEMIRDLKPLGLLQPPAAMANTRDEAIAKANELGYPVLVRPSYVLGGQGMKIAHSEKTLKEYIDQAILLSNNHPVLIDRFLNKATEVDVDAISDGNEVFIGGIMEHIEEAGVHSGDSACSIPPATLSSTVTERLRSLTRELAKKLNVIGLMNVQYAILDGQIFLLEVNPRASRTVPFVSKATGSQLAKLAAKVIAGQSLQELGVTRDLDLDVDTFNVKAPVFPFNKFPKVDTLLGPEMKSTGEVMGKGKNFAEAYSKALLASGIKLPKDGAAFLSIRDEDKTDILFMAFGLKDLGFELYATHGTAKFFRNHGLEVTGINKVAEGSPHCVDAILDGTFSLIINTTSDEQAIKDSFSIRRAALEKKIPYTTVLSAARFLLHAIREGKKGRIPVISL